MTMPAIVPTGMISQRMATREVAGKSAGWDVFMHFPSQPLIAPYLLDEAQRKTLGRRFLYRLERTFIYEFVDELQADVRIVVPQGFLSDGASVPRPFWPFIAPDGLHRAAALIHDYLYAFDGKLPQYGCLILAGNRWVDYQRTFSRKRADALFKTIMKESGVNFVTRQAAYRAVRIFARKW